MSEQQQNSGCTVPGLIIVTAMVWAFIQITVYYW
jgi:hypothetical protein